MTAPTKTERWWAERWHRSATPGERQAMRELLAEAPAPLPTAFIDGKPVEAADLPHAVTDHVLREVREEVAGLVDAVKGEQ